MLTDALGRATARPTLVLLLLPLGCSGSVRFGTEGSDTDTETATTSTGATLETSTGDTGGPDPGSATDPDSTSSATESGDDTHGSTQGESTTESVDVDPPEVVSIDPAEGSTDVMDQPVTIEFSQPMDTASLEAAFPNATGFTWTDADTTVEIVLPFPFESTATPFDIVIPTSVQDSAGNGLESPFTASITLAALVSITLDYDTVGNENGGSTGTWFYAGDTASDAMIHTGIKFPLDDLPDYGDVLGVYRAELGTQLIRLDGNPDASEMGGFLIDHVEFDGLADLADPTLLEEEFDQVFAPEDVVLGAMVETDVTAQLETSWATDATHLQLRIRAGAVLENEETDRIFLRRGAEENPNLVSDGITEPDPDNRARVEVQYFAP
jgi:hypothetical protein